MRKLAVALAASLVLCAARVDAQESAQINCGLPDPTLRFPVFTAPGSASIITNLSCGQEVTMLGIEGGYAKVQIGDRVGCIPSIFLLRQPPPVRTPSPEPQRTPSMPARPPMQSAGSVNGVRSYPQAEIFGGYSYARRGFSDGANLHGWNSSLGMNLTRSLGVVGDISGHYIGLGIPGTLGRAHTLLGGPRFFFARTPNVTPFVHALFGITKASVRSRALGGSVTVSETDFAMAFGGGLDINADRRIAIRAVQFDYLPVRSGTEFMRNARVSAGVVIKVR